MQPEVAVFRSARQVYYADTCEPVKQAVRRGDLRLEGWAHGAYPGRPLPAKTLPEVRTVGYWDAERNQTWGLDWHRNEGIEITYLASGKLGFSVEDQHYALKKGALTITRPWQIHRVGNPDVAASRLYWLILDVGVRHPNQPWKWPKWLVSLEPQIAHLTGMISHNEQPVWEANDEVAMYFEKLGEIVSGRAIDTVGTDEARIRLYVSGLILTVTELLGQHAPNRHRSLSPTYRRVDQFLMSFLPDHPEYEWRLTAMAEQCGLARSRFTYYCEEITNMSPSEYLTNCRIQKAALLLTEQRDWTITEVAVHSGFNSSQYFATVFRQLKGCSPRAYREIKHVPVA
jgi:AraC family L-rhamnose operon regulatory protein RhaS